MTTPLVECIPNFSEGRRTEVVDAIVAAILAAGGVHLLDRSSDVDHNRSVITFAGTPEAVEAAAFAGIKTAANLIDLEVHRGEHPRIGATDVVPFVPIRDVTMVECVAMAKRVGQRVAAELNIPVYLYEATAARPDRENLENIRRGEYEGLKDAIRTDPDRLPDFGPAELGKAGATVIGARAPLIAFNAYLTTSDVEIAKRIAKAIRHSSGGLHFVKALGLLVEGKAQVSMNLTNYEKTPIYRVVEMIRREAQRYGVVIAYTELIGLAPEAALIDSAQWYLQLDLFKPEQILERRLQTIAEQGDDLGNFVSEVAKGTPTPGGGSVAALAGALGAALAEMVAHLTIGKKKYAEVEGKMVEVSDKAKLLREELMAAVHEDMSAFQDVMTAYTRDKNDPQRDVMIQQATIKAADVPLKVMQQGLQVLTVARAVAEDGNINAVTDAAVATHMALAAIEGAALNVRINAKALADTDTAAAYRRDAAAIIEQARQLSAQTLAIAEQRAGLVG